MAEGQFVRTGQFGEFVRRMDERFDHVNELADQRYDNINQRFIEAEKAREQNHLHVNQRFDEMNFGTEQTN